MSEFENKVVMITGASGALGSVVTRRFAEAGASLIVVDRVEERLNTLLENLGEGHMGIIADLGDPDNLQEGMEKIEGSGRSIDVLIHTVGAYSGGTPLHESPLSELQKQLAINTQTVYVTCSAVATHMLRHGTHGRMIITLSRAADEGVKDSAASSASKAAARSLVESMGKELGPHHINVNAVSPGIIDTEANRQAMPDADHSRWVTTDQIIDAMMFLAGPQSDRVNGHNLKIYG